MGDCWPAGNLMERWELTEVAPTYLRETRGGRNVQHDLVPLLRQSVYIRLAGYEDTNDALRLARDPAMQAVIGRRALEKQAASTNTLSRFETEVRLINYIRRLTDYFGGRTISQIIPSSLRVSM